MLIDPLGFDVRDALVDAVRVYARRGSSVSVNLLFLDELHLVVL